MSCTVAPDLSVGRGLKPLPLIFTRTCGHIASVNSRPPAVGGITDQTPDSPGGRYDRGGGRNLGMAYETAQTPL
jgi:predicted amidohydrolase YtcJ